MSRKLLLTASAAAFSLVVLSSANASRSRDQAQEWPNAALLGVQAADWGSWRAGGNEDVADLRGGSKAGMPAIGETGLWSAIKSMPRTLSTGAKAIGGKIKDAVTKPGKTASGIWNGVKGAAKYVARGVKYAPSSVVLGAKIVGGKIKDTVTKPGKAAAGVWNGIKGVAKSVARGVKYAPSSVAQGAKIVGGKIKDAAKSVVTRIRKAV